MKPKSSILALSQIRLVLAAIRASGNQSRSLHSAAAFAVLTMIAGTASASAADTYEWQGGNGNWTSANWTLNGTTSNQSWNNGGYDNTATINSGSVSLDTWAAGETFNMDGGCVVNCNGNGLTFSHIYVGAGNAAITGTNNHGGGFTLESGRLQLGYGGDEQPCGGNMTVNGGQLELAVQSGHTIAGDLILNGGTAHYQFNNQIYDNKSIFADGGSLDLGSFSDIVGGMRVSNGSVISNGSLTVTGNLDLRGGTVSAPLTVGGNLVKTTSGTVTLNGNNSYAGSMTIDAGTLVLNPGGENVTFQLPTGSGISGNGGLSVTSGNIVFTGDVTLGGSQSYVQAGSGGWYRGLKVVNNTTLTASGITMQGDLGREDATDKILVLDTSSSNGTIILNDLQIGRSGILYSLQSLSANAGSGAIQITGSSSEWSATPVTLTGAVSITANLTASDPLTIEATGASTASGVLAGTMSLVKQGGGTLSLTHSNTYTGDTIVHQGVLSLGNGSSPTGLADTSSVVIDSGAKINLNFSGGDTVTSLTLGGTLHTTPGNYNATTYPAYFTGTGSLVIPGAASDYDTWAGSFTPAVGLPAADDDGDGFTNQQEYAFGLSPKSGVSVNPITSQLNKSNGKFSYTRRDPGLGTNLTYAIWTSTNLSSWTLDTGASQSVTGTSGGVQTVEVTISPILLSYPKLFIQVRAD